MTYIIIIKLQQQDAPLEFCDGPMESKLTKMWLMFSNSTLGQISVWSQWEALPLEIVLFGKYIWNANIFSASFFPFLHCFIFLRGRKIQAVPTKLHCSRLKWIHYFNALQMSPAIFQIHLFFPDQLFLWAHEVLQGGEGELC